MFSRPFFGLDFGLMSNAMATMSSDKSFDLEVILGAVPSSLHRPRNRRSTVNTYVKGLDVPCSIHPSLRSMLRSAWLITRVGL